MQFTSSFLTPPMGVGNRKLTTFLVCHLASPGWRDRVGKFNDIMGHVEDLHKHFNKDKTAGHYALRRRFDEVKHEMKRDWAIFKRESMILHGVILDDDSNDKMLINALKRGYYQ